MTIGDNDLRNVIHKYYDTEAYGLLYRMAHRIENNSSEIAVYDERVNELEQRIIKLEETVLGLLSDIERLSK